MSQYRAYRGDGFRLQCRNGSGGSCWFEEGVGRPFTTIPGDRPVNQRLKRGLQIGSSATIVALSPLAFSLENGITEQAACAQNGTCCPESQSLCVVGGQLARDYYFKSEGSCIRIE
jgi:hypothetical protein